MAGRWSSDRPRSTVAQGKTSGFSGHPELGVQPRTPQPCECSSSPRVLCSGMTLQNAQHVAAPSSLAEGKVPAVGGLRSGSSKLCTERGQFCSVMEQSLFQL